MGNGTAKSKIRGNENTGQVKDMGQGTQGLGLRHKGHLAPDTAHRDTEGRGNGDVERTLDTCQGQTEDMR